MKTPIEPGCLVIVNWVDCPRAELIALVSETREEENSAKIVYIGDEINTWGEFPLDRMTCVCDFGISVIFDSSLACLTCLPSRDSIATYELGGKRLWQGHPYPDQVLVKRSLVEQVDAAIKQIGWVHQYERTS